MLPRLCNEDYAAAICRSKICLCFYSQWNRDTDNSRMYEIPACGVFMLAERNDENVRVFAEGVEADFFSTPEELVAKVRHYLVHDAEREAIAARGLKRCRSSGYSYAQRLATMMQQISAEPLHCSGEG
ncbi:MAG TPA: hypothetical protein DCM68_05975 [Verrucomicrobia bacterium]|nr:hypothetical protein [Verrucomicrobiota bacterium]